MSDTPTDAGPTSDEGPAADSEGSGSEEGPPPDHVEGPPIVHEERPPGPDRLPVLGNTFDYLNDPLAFWTEIAREYGPVAYYELGTQGFYQLSDPALVEQVLVHDNTNYCKGEVYQSALGPPLGKGLLTSEGEFWRQQRHAIQPAFHPDRLDAFGDVMADRSANATMEWTDGEVRNVHDDMMELTVGIAADALFGVDIAEFEDAVSDALEGVMDQVERRAKRPVDVPVWLPTAGNRRYRRSLATLEKVADAVVEQQLGAMEAEGGVNPLSEAERTRSTSDSDDAGPGPNVVRLLRENDGADASREQLRDEVVTLLLAGHETTALALTYTFHLLGRNPEVAATLLDELDAVLDGNPPTVADLPDLTYTESVITESMRLYPPVHELLREPTEDVVLGGYRIPEGSTINVQQWVLHRDSEIFDDPTAFRPDRWTGDRREELPAFAYFPFGGGPRRCIGDRFAMQEAQIVLATIVSDWTFEPQHGLSFAPSITLRPDGPVKMRVRRR